MQENHNNNQEPKLEKKKKEAFKIRSEGKTKLALEKLEQAIQREEKWYHHFYKVIWLWETNKITDVAKVIEYGLEFNKGEEFYFRYLNADALYRVITPKALQDIDNTIKALDQAIIELNLADLLYNNYYPHVQDSRDKIPNELKELCPTFINDEDLIDKVRSLRTKIEMFKQFTILANAGIQSENRVNAAIERNRQKIDSERVRTIELLGIFTAIFAFIFSGVQILSRMHLSEALVLQAGIALIMIIFFLGLHIVIEPEARTKSLIFILSLLIIILFALPLYAKLLRNISKNDLLDEIQVSEFMSPTD